MADVAAPDPAHGVLLDGRLRSRARPRARALVGGRAPGVLRRSRGDGGRERCDPQARGSSRGELIDEKERSPGDDLTSTLLVAVEAGALSRRDVRSLLTELLGASVENTTHSMGIAVWLLSRHPDQWRTVASDDRLLGRAVEECARFEPVIRHGNHFNEDDATVLDVPVPAGTLVTAYIAGAHRDPAVYDEPDRFDVTRAPRSRSWSSASAGTTASAPRWPAWRSRSSSARSRPGGRSPGCARVSASAPPSTAWSSSSRWSSGCTREPPGVDAGRCNG